MVTLREKGFPLRREHEKKRKFGEKGNKRMLPALGLSAPWGRGRGGRSSTSKIRRASFHFLSPGRREGMLSFGERGGRDSFLRRGEKEAVPWPIEGKKSRTGAKRGGVKGEKMPSGPPWQGREGRGWGRDHLDLFTQVVPAEEKRVLGSPHFGVKEPFVGRGRSSGQKPPRAGTGGDHR